MTEAVDTENAQVGPDVAPEAEPEFAWRLVRLKDDPGAKLELGPMYADLPDQMLTPLMHVIAESLIKAGTQLLQSRVGDDDEDEDGLGDD